MLSKGFSRVAGVGAYLPKQKVSSESLLEEAASYRFDIPTNFMSEKMGIQERRIESDDTLLSDMAVNAAKEAIENAGVKTSEIDLIIYCGIEGDFLEPSTAHYIQATLGASQATCLDISNACHGFMNGVEFADSHIASGRAQTVLVCTAEKLSRLMFDALVQLRKTDNKEDFKRRLGLITVGDAAGAMIIQPSTSKSGWKGFNLASTGEHANLCYYKHNGDNRDGQMLMKGISAKMLEFHESLLMQTYSLLKWTHSDIDKLFCQQPGTKWCREMINLSQMHPNNVPVICDYLGNIASASIPVNMALNPPSIGDKVLVMGAGSGISISQSGLVF